MGSFDIVPYSFMILNCIGWCVYSRGMPSPARYFEYFTNWAGIVAGLLVLGATFHLATPKSRKSIIFVFIFTIALYLPLDFLLESCINQQTNQQILGYLAVIFQLLFFASPLNQIYQIVKTKIADVLYFPLALTGMICTGLWGLYGIFIADSAVATPNILSCLLGVLQILLIFIYRNNSKGGVIEEELSEMK